MLVDDVDRLIRARRHQLIYDTQLRSSVGSIAANIRESYGRRVGAERNQFLRFARGSAEETDEHLSANHRTGRISAPEYWRFHNRLIVVVRMLNSMMKESPGPSVPPLVP